MLDSLLTPEAFVGGGLESIDSVGVTARKRGKLSTGRFTACEDGGGVIEDDGGGGEPYLVWSISP